MGNILALAVVGGGLWYAHREGYLDDILAGIDVGGIGGVTADPAAPAASGGLIVRPDLGVATSLGEENPHVKMLRANERALSTWAQNNIYWTAAIAKTENAGMNPLAIGKAGEFGVMQVMPGTAGDLDRWGYKKYPPTREVLQTVEGGIYFGTAYLDYVSKKKPLNTDWIIRAYNGGPGWEYAGESSLKNTANYLKLVTANFRKIRTGG